WLAINRIVLHRVRTLVADVEEIGTRRDLSRRVTVKGRDELAVLAAAINQTVGALEGAVLGRERSERRFSQLFESVPCGVYESSPDGRLAAVNPALVTMLGYSSAAELLRVDIGRDLYFDPEERRPFIEEMTERGEFRNVELTLRRKDGSRVVVLENSRVVHDEAGKVVAFRGTLVDITERKAMEDALEAARSDLEARVTARTAELSSALTEVAEKEERFRLLIETAGSAILVLAPDGRIEECNPAAEEIFACRRSDLIGADYARRFVQASEREAVRQNFAAVMAGKVTRGL
ncbi:MAG: PAS domain S-box protein, partial [Acidobacteria bacterium]|nr:PAS domain S-box protein [Acidobacteriota bacterium]